MKTTWNIINEHTNNKPKVHDIPFLKLNEAELHNSQTIAEAFNTYFSSVAQHINTSKLYPDDKPNPLIYLRNASRQPIPQINLKFVSSNEIVKVVISLKLKNSHGYDEIPTKILKPSLPYILSPLTYLCNLMISSGVFPSRLKYAEIIPVHKKGEKSNISNYRPISLLNSFSKILKKLFLQG
jgi:hypothetical protein